MNTTRRRRAILPLLIAGCLGWAWALPSTAQPATAPAAERPAKPGIKIAAWNIEWLGTPDKRRPPGNGHLQRVDHIADYVAMSGADVVLLQEIAAPWLSARPDGFPNHIPEPAEPYHLDTFQNPVLDAVCHELSARSRGATDWRHVIFPARGNSIVHCLGVMWNSEAVEPVGPPIPLFEEERTPMIRPPWAMTFRPAGAPGWTDFVVIPVHFKAGRDSAGQRHDEAQALRAAIAEKIDDGDVVVMGDTNTRDSRNPPIRTFVESGFRDLNAGNASTIATGRSALSRTLIPADQREFAGARQIVLNRARLGNAVVSGDAFRRLLSDHCMIVTSIRFMPDDD